VSGRHHYRVNIQGDRLHYGRANNRLVYCPPHDGEGWHRSKNDVLTVELDNAVGTDGQLRYVWQPQVQSKVDVLSALPATAAEATVQVEHRLNLVRQIGKMATRIDRHFFSQK